MEFKYKLNKDVVARTAANLAFELNNFYSDIHILNNNRLINAKSLIGILQGNLRYDNIITIYLTHTEDLNKIKEIFNQIGKEVI